jgi:hypothetical protein
MPQKCVASRTDRHYIFQDTEYLPNTSLKGLEARHKSYNRIISSPPHTHTHTHKELLIKRLKRKECLTLTLSTTITSIEPLRIKVSTRLSACSPQSGCERSKFWVFTPIDSASDLSSACSASIKAQYPAYTNLPINRDS